MRSTRLAALALSLALALGVADSALAQDNPRARCIQEAAQAGLVGADLNPSNANFIGGTFNGGPCDDSCGSVDPGATCNP